MPMDIHSLDWDEDLLNLFEIPKKCLPKILSSSDDYGVVTKNEYLNGIKITG